MRHTSNGMSGESHFTLCVDTLSEVDGELVAYSNYDDAGLDDVPHVTLIAREYGKKKGGRQWMFDLDIEQLRRLCDLVEAQHKFGLVQLREIGGVCELEEVSDE